MGNDNRYDDKTLQEIIRKLLTFDQEACFESVKKEMLKQIKSDHECGRVMTPERIMAEEALKATRGL